MSGVGVASGSYGWCVRSDSLFGSVGVSHFGGVSGWVGVVGVGPIVVSGSGVVSGHDGVVGASGPVGWCVRSGGMPGVGFGWCCWGRSNRGVLGSDVV